MSKSIPKDLGLPLIGHLLPYQKDRLKMLVELGQKHGEIFELKVGPRHLVVINSPEMIKQVLQTEFDNFVKRNNTKDIFGDSLASANAESWKEQRSMLQPLFSSAFLKESLVHFENLTQSNLENYDSNPNFSNMNVFFSKITFDIILKCIIGLNSYHQFEKVDKALVEISNSATNKSYLPVNMPKFLNPGQKRLENSHFVMREIIKEGIDLAKENEDSLSLVNVLIKATKNAPELLRRNKNFINDNVFTLIFAGYETTSQTLSWLSYLLSQNKKWQNLCIEEAINFSNSKEINHENLKDLKYIDAVINESLRLYPPGWAFTRANIKETDLCGYHLKADQTVLISPFLTQRTSTLWEKHDSFYPERWLEKTPAQFGRYNFFPFSSGPRVCIGMQFAMMEMRIILITILKNYKFTLDGHHPIMDARVTLFSKNGFNIKLEEHNQK